MKGLAPWLMVLVLCGCDARGPVTGGLDTMLHPADRFVADTNVDPADVGNTDDAFVGLLDIAQDFTPGVDTGTNTDIDVATPPLCLGDGDGVLTMAELPMVIGAVAAFTVSASGETVTVPNPAGTWDPDCACHRWDLSAPLPSDDAAWDGVLPGTGHWFDAFIPVGDFVQSFGGGLLGIYLLEADGLYMTGLASKTEDWTALAYDPPVKLLALPMGLGETWTTLSEASGIFEGSAYPLDTGPMGRITIHHAYAGEVDKQGRIAVPAGEYPVWRVVVDITMEVQNSIAFAPIASSRRKVVLFMAECAGLVARIRSAEDETDDDFHTATELRRLGWTEEAR